jgi:hypothetical protein
LEVDIKTSSSDLVSACAVIGSGRDYIGVVIEPVDGSIVGNPTAEAELKQKILEKQIVLNERRYKHERIHELRQLAIIAPGSLPRSVVKGIVRRDAVEAKTMPEVFEALFGPSLSSGSCS